MIYSFHTLLKHIIVKAEIREARNKIGFIGANVSLSANLKIIGGAQIKLFDNVYIGPDSRLEAWNSYNGNKFSPQIIIEEGVRINSKAHIGAIGKIIIGSGTLLGSNVFITDHSHGRSDFNELQIPPYDRNLFYAGSVIIGKNCWLCENVIVLPNTIIGDGCIIGAGTVVQGNIPAYSVVVGTKGHVIKTLNEV